MSISTVSYGRAPSTNISRPLGSLLAVLLLASMTIVATPSQAEAQETKFFMGIWFGDSWAYLDDGSDPGSRWKNTTFNDAGWSRGGGELGYGDGGEATTVGFGSNSSAKHVTTYFRKDFVVPSGVQTVKIKAVRDDGIAIHINGVEVARDNLPSSYGHLTPASAVVSGAGESEPVIFNVDPTLVRTGTNTIAVEIHQFNGTSSDISFDLQLNGAAADYDDFQAPTTPTNVRSTARTSSSITLKWADSTDNIGVQSYRVFRDGTFVGSVVTPGTTYVDTGLGSNTAFSYQVKARDFVGNQSAMSGAATVSTEVNSSLELSEQADEGWQTNGKVHTILPIGDVVYLGGEFTKLDDGNGNSINRNNLAAIDRLTGLPTSFNPNINDKVFALKASPDEKTLYVGGSFTAAGGVTRKKLATFNVANGALTSFDPASPNNSVRAIDTDGTRLFIGGLFQEVGSQRRLRLAAYNLATGQLDTKWTPETDDGVKALIVDPDKVWVAGNFDRINGASSVGFGAVNLTNGNRITTDSPGLAVIDPAAQGNRLFLAGGGVGGTGYSYNRTTGRQQWAIRSDGNFQGVGVLGDYVYFGGHWDYFFDPSGNIFTWGLTRHNVQTGAIDKSWFPRLNGIRGINAIEADGPNVYIGGDFSHVTGDRHMGFASFTDETPNVSAAQLQSLTMLDEDENGYVDTVKAWFDRDLAPCIAPCIGGWILTDIPSDGTLRKVSTEGRVAILEIEEGTGAFDTSVGDFTVRLAPWAKIKDARGAQPTFVERPPADNASPLPHSVRRTNVGTSGLAEPGDALKIEWTEPLDPASVPATTKVVISDPADGGSDELSIVGLAAGSTELGATDYLQCPDGPCDNPQEATFGFSQVELSSSGRLTTVTLTSCAGNCGKLTDGSRTTLTLTAASTVRDLAGNSAIGSTDKTLKLF